jgi:hypothetical protein
MNLENPPQDSCAAFDLNERVGYLVKIQYGTEHRTDCLQIVSKITSK